MTGGTGVESERGGFVGAGTGAGADERTAGFRAGAAGGRVIYPTRVPPLPPPPPPPPTRNAFTVPAGDVGIQPLCTPQSRSSRIPRCISNDSPTARAGLIGREVESRRSRTRRVGYFTSLGMKPMTETPAPRAMSMASITS